MLKKILLTLLAIVTLTAILLATQYRSDIPLDTLKTKYAQAPSQFVELNGMKVHYRIEGEGMPVVLIHGTAASLHTWDDWTAELKKDFKVIRFDLPAFGLTGPHPQRDYSIKAYTEFVAAFLDKMDVDSCYLAGNSLGGRIAWNFALEHPDLVKKMILVDASGYPMDKAPSLGFKLAQNPWTGWLMRSITPRSLVEKSVLEVFEDDSKVTDALVDRYYDMLLRAGNRQAFIDRSNTDYIDRTAQIPTIQTPTLLQWGKQDDWVPLELGQHFDRDLPNSRLIIYDGAGHVPMEEIPQKTVADAKAFFKGAVVERETETK